jgi:hypothetical protein
VKTKITMEFITKTRAKKVLKEIKKVLCLGDTFKDKSQCDKNCEKCFNEIKLKLED